MIVVAPPGTGKTTLLPKLVFDAFGDSPEIVVLEPRRIAAKLAAQRLASHFNQKPGGTVGYSFRSETVDSPQTRIKFYTEGTFNRRLLRDPNLKNVKIVMLDEFHERNLQGDLAIALLKKLQTESRPDLKIIVMSATPDIEAIQNFLTESVIVEVPVSVYPIDIEYIKIPTMQKTAPPLALQVKKYLERILQSHWEGDILIFFPGIGDLQRSLQECDDLGSRYKLDLIPLHGELEGAEQMRAFGSSAQRKIVFSTNIAESSVTVDGVRIVIDTGFFREAQTSSWSGIRELVTKKVSQASAIQRAGRANRQGPGHCLRLYTKEDLETRLRFAVPEIQRSDLTQVLLELYFLGVKNMESFLWFEKPAPSEIVGASQILWQIGAIDSSSTAAQLTNIGRILCELPVNPRWGRCLLAANANKVLDPMIHLCALLEQDPKFSRDRVFSLTELQDEIQQRERHPKFLREVQRLQGAFKSHRFELQNDLTNQSPEEKLALSLLMGFSDHVAQVTKSGAEGWRFQLQSGESSQNFTSPPPKTGWAVVLKARRSTDLRYKQNQLVVESFVEISPDWLSMLEPSPLKEVEILRFDEGSSCVVEQFQIKLGELVIIEDESRGRGPKASAYYFQKVLNYQFDDVVHLGLEEAIGRLVANIKNRKDEPTSLHHESQWVRLFLLSRFEKIKGLDSSNLAKNLYSSCTSHKELENWSLTERWLEVCEEDVSQNFNYLAPIFIELPSGRKTKVNYKLGHEPWIESRMQDFFGLKITPTIFGGKLPLKVHLLAPNGRAVQVTQDLMSFWKNTYPEVRKELMRRYPRHSWPESPL